MKNILAVAILLIGFFSRPALAQVDNSCFAKLTLPTGKVKKQLIERKAYVQIGKVLNIGFLADFFDGEKPVLATLLIQDAHDKNRYETLSSEINYNWKWHIERTTPYGKLVIDCD